jgi:hypothetical protein
VSSTKLTGNNVFSSSKLLSSIAREGRGRKRRNLKYMSRQLHLKRMYFVGVAMIMGIVLIQLRFWAMLLF